MTQQNQQVAAAAIVKDQAWLGELQEELRAAIAPVFAQARSRLTRVRVRGGPLLAAGGDRRSCWQLAEAAGHGSPRRMQALLGERAWDWKAALRGLQRFILAHLADPGAILVLDETAELKKGTMTAGVSRQHAGITGQVKSQSVVFCAYVTACAHALFDFRLYLQSLVRRQGTEAGAGTGSRRGGVRRQDRARHGDGSRGSDRAVPFGWGRRQRGLWPRLEAAGRLREAGKGYVLGVPCDFRVRLHPRLGKTRADAVARLVPAAAWDTRSCGPGCKGHRDYHWAWAATASPRHWLLIRRSIADPSDLAFFYCHAPAGRPVSLPALITVAGKRWPVEECHQQGKGQAGLDQHQVRLWPSFHRHTILSMCALALLAVAAARPLQPAPLPQGTDGSPASAGTPARGLGRHRGAAIQRRPETPRPDRHGQSQRPRSPPPPAPGNRAHDRRPPRIRPRLVTMAPRTPGTRPMALLPGTTPARPGLTRRQITNRNCSTG